MENYSYTEIAADVRKDSALVMFMLLSFLVAFAGVLFSASFICYMMITA